MSERVDPDSTADEKTSLLQYLDYHRETLLWKTEGLTKAQLGQTIPTSTLTLAGLLKHLSLVEDSWINNRFFGRPENEPWVSAPFDDDPDWEFHSALDDDPGYLRGLYRETAERTRTSIADSSLDDFAVVPRKAGSAETAPWTLRWGLLHLIEETARHNGHADILREAIDGAVGE
jgi:uncharacterized damage-inducible protein DinB